MATYKYTHSGPLDPRSPVDKDKIKGKTAIVTGGAAGIGRAYVRALVEAGAYVVIADINETAGDQLQQELPNSTTFVKCDVTSWQSLLAAFKQAKGVSPTSRIDVVVANAGVNSLPDDILFQDTSTDEPKEPNMSTFAVNANGVLLTAKLALWYFQKQNDSDPNQDQCLVLQSSLGGYVELKGPVQYVSSKFAVRGLMRTLRLTQGGNGIRVNLIAPWFINTGILVEIAVTAIDKTGAGWAAIEDAGQALLRIVGDSTIHGRAIAIVPRDEHESPNGYIDLDQDDFEEGSWLGKRQELVKKPGEWVESQQQTTP